LIRRKRIEPDHIVARGCAIPSSTSAAGDRIVAPDMQTLDKLISAQS
jgi:hypothetical protein